MSEPLIQDQEDFDGRLEADPYFADITVLMERKGVIEDDIDVALTTLNTKASKLGVCVVILMPSIVPSEPDAPGPEFFVEMVVNVYASALINNDTGNGGTGKQAEEIAERIRQLMHRAHLSQSIYSFARMEPIPVKPGDVGYGVVFRRRAQDATEERCGMPLISPDEGAAPLEVTLTTATSGASIYYTTDGSYPSSANDEATLYTVPFTLATAARLRCAAEKSGMQQSGISEATFT